MRHSCPSGEELPLRIKQAYLILTFFVVATVAMLYGISPQWFARRFLGVAEVDRNLAHILRAVLGLSIGMGLFWLFAATRSRHRNTAVLTTLIIAAGRASGRTGERQDHQPGHRWAARTALGVLHACGVGHRAGCLFGLPTARTGITAGKHAADARASLA